MTRLQRLVDALGLEPVVLDVDQGCVLEFGMRRELDLAFREQAECPVGGDGVTGEER